MTNKQPEDVHIVQRKVAVATNNVEKIVGIITFDKSKVERRLE